MRHQELLFSASVLSAAIALDDRHHPRNMRLGPWICHRERQREYSPRSHAGVVDRNDPLCDMVARKVIEVGASGPSEPREIAEMAVARIGLR